MQPAAGKWRRTYGAMPADGRGTLLARWKRRLLVKAHARLIAIDLFERHGRRSRDIVATALRDTDANSDDRAILERTLREIVALEIWDA